MIGKKTIATSTASLFLAAGFAATGCGLFGDEAEDGGGDDKGGGTAGVSGNPTGGSSTGGVSGTGTTGGSSTGGATGGSTTGGSSTGGAGGVAGNAGAGGGAAAMGPYGCATPQVANCGAVSDFPIASGQTFGNMMFSGGMSVFGDGITRDMMNTGGLHVTGMVSGYGRGFNIWFSLCSSLQMYGGVEFIVSGTTTDAMAMNTIEFQAQTNTNYPWQPFVASNGVKGACTAPDPAMAWNMCIAPGKTGIVLGATAQQVMWADVSGGGPAMWNPAMSPSELVGLQWQFPWSEGRAAYMVDVTLDDVKFIGGTGPTTACPAYSTGAGGMGGAGGAPGGAGGAPGGAGGAPGGAGGAPGGAGGMAGGAGRSSGAGGA